VPIHLDPAVDWFLRTGFLALFASSLAHKVYAFGEFRLTVAAYFRGVHWASSGLLAVLAVLMVVGEFAVVAACVGLLDGLWRALLTGGVLALYAAAMGGNLWRGNRQLDCGCHWGAVSQPVTMGLVWRNVVLAGVAFLMAVPVAARSLNVLDFVTVLAGCAVAGLFYAGFNRLVALPLNTGGVR
jgi:hypothetical protein